MIAIAIMVVMVIAFHTIQANQSTFDVFLLELTVSKFWTYIIHA